MSYLNQVVRRTAPMTRCQCAVLAVVGEDWAGIDAIWKRRPVYVVNRTGRVEPVAYGTIHAILRGLLQQGFVEARGGRRKEYRRTG